MFAGGTGYRAAGERRKRLDGEELGLLDVGEPWEILRAVRVQRVRRGSTRDANDTVLGAVLDLHVVIGKQSAQFVQEAAGDDDGPIAFDLALERRPKRELHVGRGERHAPLGRLEEDAREDLNGRASRDGTRDHREPRHQLVARARDFHTGADHCFYLNHL